VQNQAIAKGQGVLLALQGPAAGPCEAYVGGGRKASQACPRFGHAQAAARRQRSGAAAGAACFVGPHRLHREDGSNCCWSARPPRPLWQQLLSSGGAPLRPWRPPDTLRLEAACHSTRQDMDATTNPPCICLAGLAGSHLEMRLISSAGRPLEAPRQPKG